MALMSYTTRLGLSVCDQHLVNWAGRSSNQVKVNTDPVDGKTIVSKQ